ncbi:ribonuclease H-like domain-containing protein [Tanacetum coccineum]
MVTRFQLGKNKPTKRLTLNVSAISPIPKSYNIAFSDPNWQRAMLDEYNALIKNKTLILVPRPPNTNIIRSMWLFKHKYFADGSLSRYKARLVANSRSQQVGVDCDETFSPVVKPATIRTVRSLAASRHWPVYQLDVKNAFLHGNLSEMVYMHQPLGFQDPQHPDYVCLLQRSLYGVKQAPRAWFQRFGSDTAYLLLYVDDILLTASSTTFLQHIISSLHKEFSMCDLGPLNYFLGISVTRDSSGMFLSQHQYALEILERAGMLNCQPSRALQYLTFTRPDLSYAVQQLYASSSLSSVGYTNADWAGCPATRRSTSGYCVFLGNNLISWSSKRQVTLSRSSAEAEYHGVANVVAETAWIRNLLWELHSPLSTATLVYCDNVSAVYLSSNPVQHQRTKHIEIDIHFVRDQVAAGRVRVLHVPSRYQFADIFTKGLPYVLFDDFWTSLSCNTPKSGLQRNVEYPRALLHRSIAQDMRTTTKRVI